MFSVLLQPSFYPSIPSPFVVATSEEQRVEKEVAGDENLIFSSKYYRAGLHEGNGVRERSRLEEKDALF